MITTHLVMFFLNDGAGAGGSGTASPAHWGRHPHGRRWRMRPFRWVSFW
jgi:hypothetical protein